MSMSAPTAPPIYNHAGISLHLGDCRTVLAGLPDGCVQTVVTSPPYFGLRDYGTAEWEGGDSTCGHRADTAHQRQGVTSQRAGRSNVEEQRNENFREFCGKCGARRIDHQIGLEATPAAFVAEMVAVFREVRRCLRDDGTCWIVLGDSYAGSWGNYSGQKRGKGDGQRPITVGSMPTKAWEGRELERPAASRKMDGIKEKDLIGIPWMTAFALRADGWYLRSAITWCKGNPMPESVTDRPTSATEMVFLLSKAPRYYYDADAIREPHSDASLARYEYGLKVTPNPAAIKGSLQDRLQAGIGNSERMGDFMNPAGRNRRNWWLVNSHAFPAAHFATFPPKLIEPMILAGTSERGACPECGAPWQRIVERESNWQERKAAGGTAGNVGVSPDYQNGVHGRGMSHDLGGGASTDRGWQPTCTCGRDDTVPCVVLDPFCGAGTTLLVSKNLGRHGIGVELNETYCRLIVDRLRQDVFDLAAIS